MSSLRKVTLTHILLATIAVLTAVNGYRTNRRIHELDQDVDNIVDFTQKTSDSLDLMRPKTVTDSAK